MLHDIDEVIKNLQDHNAKIAHDSNMAKQNHDQSLNHEKNMMAMMAALKQLKDHWGELNTNQQKQTQMIVEHMMNQMDTSMEKYKPNVHLHMDGMLQGMESLFEKQKKPVEIAGLADHFKSLEKQLGNLQDKLESSIAQLEFQLPEIKIPDLAVKGSQVDLTPVIKSLVEVRRAIESIKIPVAKTQDLVVDLKPVVQSLQSLETKITKLKGEPVNLDPVIEATQGVETAIRSLKFPVPTPVTQFDLNPLRGSIKSTAVTVGTTATALPATALANRRVIQVYNNDASVNLFIGGSDVSSTNGFLVKTTDYSPPLDIGNSMTLYGVAGSGSINVRVIEVSNDAIGSS